MKKFLLSAALVALALMPVAAQAVDPNQYATITASSPTTCTPIANIQFFLIEVRNANTAQTGVLKLFDEGANPTCAAADQIYGETLAASANRVVVTRLSQGLAYTLSAAAAGNIVITGTSR